MDLSDLLAGENANIQAKEAEALAILTACATPAMRTLDSAKREFGHVLGIRELGEFVSPTAHELYKKGKKDATRFLFDAYATTVFRRVPDAEIFIAFLPAIGDRVNTKLNNVSDRYETELCRLEWEKRAWERAKPNPFRSAWKKWQSIWRRTALDSAHKPSAGVTAQTAQEVSPAAHDAVSTNGCDTTLDSGGAQVGTLPEPRTLLRNRSSWLDARLLERGWTTSDPSRWGGPDRKTIEKIQRGEAVTNPVLLKLADALSKQHGKVTVFEIPKD